MYAAARLLSAMRTGPEDRGVGSLNSAGPCFHRQSRYLGGATLERLIVPD